MQTAVKRTDEQAFDLANDQNLMFCEDAARRLHTALPGWEIRPTKFRQAPGWRGVQPAAQGCRVGDETAKNPK